MHWFVVKDMIEIENDVIEGNKKIKQDEDSNDEENNEETRDGKNKDKKKKNKE